MPEETYIQPVEGFYVELAGDGGMKGSLVNTYRSFEIGGDRSVQPDVTFVFEPVSGRSTHILGKRRKHFGRRGENFIIKDGGDMISIRSDFSRFRCSPTRPNWHVPRLLEGEIRKRAIDQGLAMIHASGVIFHGKTILMPAWRHTGKTNTMLNLLTRGADVLSDDRLFVDASGTARSYHLPINMLPYNFRSFPELQSSSVQRVRGLLSQKLDQLIADGNSDFAGGLDLINNAYLKPKSKYIHVSEAFPEHHFEGETDVDVLLLLQTTTGGPDAIDVERVDGAALASVLSNISLFEWNSLLDELYSAFDTLFPKTASQRERLHELERREDEVFDRLARDVPTYKLTVPREDIWREDTKAEIVSNIESLVSSL